MGERGGRGSRRTGYHGDGGSMERAVEGWRETGRAKAGDMGISLAVVDPQCGDAVGSLSTPDLGPSSLDHREVT